MKKKNLIILLIIPFLISLLGIITINISINTFYGDITSIKWDYDDVEAFKLSNQKYKLNATAYNASNAPLDNGNSLIWRCENVDESIEEPVAEIVFENENYYLKTHTTGEVTIMCSNLKGNIFRKMNAIIYDTGVIIINPVISSSQNNIDDDIYYGQYDLVNGEKQPANFDVKIRCIPNEISNSLIVFDKSDNIEINPNNGKVTIKTNGDAYFSLTAGGLTPSTYKFKIVENGVNVYTYDDLLACTNKSENGEVVVLRKSFDTEANKYASKSNNVEIFGNYSKNDQRYMFENDIYYFETTFNQEYIKQWNEFVKENPRYGEVLKYVFVGLRVQKDFYGNGYTINMHNLTYPSKIYRPEGYDFDIPELGDYDLFRGPLPFYTLGNPNTLPLVSAYGQDNIGMYIDGNNITVNDVNIRNCDLKGSLSFLDTVGTVVEVNGDNNSIINSRLSNGKNILRCFSTNNFTLDNSLLSNSRNFLMEVGSNEYLSYDEAKKYNFISSTGNTTNTTLSEYFDTKEEKGDLDLNNYLLGQFDNSNAMRNSLESIQNALNQNGATNNIFKGSINVNDTYFYNSGIAAIALESMFNGPFLYSASPSLITDVFALMGDSSSQSVVPYTATKVGGVSYPVKLKLSGKTRFYDYKDSSNIDITGLIKENISIIANEVFGEDRKINIDTIFPIKPMLLSKARNQGSIYTNLGTEYINIPITYYGGGSNFSVVNIDDLEGKEKFGNLLKVDFLDEYLVPSSTSDLMAQMKDVMLKSVTVVTGFEPFKFICMNNEGYLFGESPNANDLIQNAKGV